MPRETAAPSEREQALQEAVLSYLKAVDAGRPPDRREVLARHPDLAEELAAFFADQERLDPLVAPLRDPAAGPDARRPSPRNTGSFHEPAPDPDGAAPGPPAIPGYEILGPLQRGGMGVVYKARQVRLDRVVALKMIQAHHRPDGGERARFHAEARTVARLDHPHIVRVYDSGEQGGVPYLVLEYVAGGSLADRLEAGPWPPAAAARLLLPLAEAIDFAHRQGVVHRDLKPANILLTPDGVPKVADFGLSKQMRAAAGGLTQAGDVLGTPAFMAPEQAEGRTDALGPGTDVFGLGAVLYALLTGRPPFQGDTVSEVLRRAKGGQVTAPRQLNGRVPPALERICLKAMAADLRQRHPSAAALAGELRRYLDRAKRRAWAAAALTGLLAAAAPLCLPAFDRPKAANHEPPGPAPEPDLPALAGRAGAILKAHCHRCHGADGNVEGGFNYVLDRRQLVLRKRVVPGEPDASRLLKRVEAGEMPPEGEAPRPGPEDVALLREWIRAGAPDFPPGAPGPRFLSAEHLYRLIRDDLEKADETDRPFYRYFTIAHLANAGLPEDSLQTYRLGLSRLVNSLSWEPAVAPPAAIDPGRTVFRIDLRHYAWAGGTWERILAAYPYGVVPASGLAEECAKLTRCPLPLVRADWFVSAASQPPLYHDVLGLPATARELEERLQVDVAGNLRTYRAARAGFNGSGVAQGNRLIERHPAKSGAYWRSYDFAPGGGRKNLFQHPLGPGPDPDAFEHDGGEVIFSLPNGLQGYLLVDAAGRRIDRADPKLVKDPRSKDGAVVNGLSCMRCHAHGMIEKDDQIREHVAGNALMFPGQAATVRALYKPREGFSALLREDAQRFAAAVARATGAPPTATDPAAALASQYDWDLDAKLAAAELGLTRDDFLERLSQSEDLRRVMGQLKNDGGTVQRPVFDANFLKLVATFQLGAFHRTALRPPEPPAARPAPEPPAAPGLVIENSVRMKLRRIEAGQFAMGSPADDPDAGDEEKPRHTVVISRPFRIGVYEVTRQQYAAVMGPEKAQAVLNRHGNPGGRDEEMPMTGVSRDEAEEFCRRLTGLPKERQAGRVYRLPTEAEWEYACRAGAAGRFSFSGGVGQLGNHAWYDGNSGGRPHPVGEKPANAWGLYDMHGNVAEWCADRYEPGYYRVSPAQDPPGPAQGALSLYVLRGGSFEDDAARLRCADRHPKPGNDAPSHGFRVVLILE